MLVAWLHGKVGYAGLRQALALQAGGKVRRALAEVTDTTWVKFEKDWRAHLRTLDLSGGRATGVRSAKHARIRFAKAAPPAKTSASTTSPAPRPASRRAGRHAAGPGHDQAAPSSTVSRWPPPAAST